MSDPKVAAIPVTECGEHLVDVRSDGSLLVDEREQDPADAFAHVRAGVLDRLLVAQARLPQGLRLLFVEGYRPPHSSASTSRSTPANCAPAVLSGRPHRTGPLLVDAARPRRAHRPAGIRAHRAGQDRRAR